MKTLKWKRLSSIFAEHDKHDFEHKLYSRMDLNTIVVVSVSEL